MTSLGLYLPPPPAKEKKTMHLPVLKSKLSGISGKGNNYNQLL